MKIQSIIQIIVLLSCCSWQDVLLLPLSQPPHRSAHQPPATAGPPTQLLRRKSRLHNLSQPGNTPK